MVQVFRRWDERFRHVWINHGETRGWVHNNELTDNLIEVLQESLCEDCAQPTFVNTYGTDQGLRLADINGDGLADFVWAPSLEWESGPKPSFMTYLNNGNGWERVSTDYWKSPLGFVNYITDLGTFDLGARMMDINGDGQLDFIRSKDNPGTDILNTFIFANNISNTSAWQELYPADPYWKPPCFFVQERAGFHQFDVGCRAVDVNADGLLDFLVRYQ